jgi:hypothetical protein
MAATHDGFRRRTQAESQRFRSRGFH